MHTLPHIQIHITWRLPITHGAYYGYVLGHGAWV